MSATLKARVGIEWINNFHADQCTQHNLSYCDDQADGFHVFMAFFGHTAAAQ
jgi:hypothetical protein